MAGDESRNDGSEDLAFVGPATRGQDAKDGAISARFPDAAQNQGERIMTDTQTGEDPQESDPGQKPDTRLRTGIFSLLGR